MSRFHHVFASAAAAATSAVLLVGCGGGGDETPSATSTTAPPAVTAPVQKVITIDVALVDLKIELSRSSFTPGTYKFDVVNKGQFPHNLTIKGPGVDNVGTPTLPPGGTGSVTVNLQPGSYEFYCTVDAHAQHGMKLDVEVS